MEAPKTLDVVDFIGEKRYSTEAHEITDSDRDDHCAGDNDGDCEEDL